ncbi:hypothetical protein [Deinococcus radiotolerans]|uniref:Uncharacterized protein n=1 Tax=Deinococcus radiotolerans TaxID=1309407 RepID=A0ABQ2FRR1_9DEIO|nr:hypothetical protein [Deinococcus radiotolerans]GGL20598.1 hypothetical protein GCM10010844_44280 [Deinococcus radiotolerans]
MSKVIKTSELTDEDIFFDSVYVNCLIDIMEPVLDEDTFYSFVGMGGIAFYLLSEDQKKYVYNSFETYIINFSRKDLEGIPSIMVGIHAWQIYIVDKDEYLKYLSKKNRNHFILLIDLIERSDMSLDDKSNLIRYIKVLPTLRVIDHFTAVELDHLLKSFDILKNTESIDIEIYNLSVNAISYLNRLVNIFSLR